MKVYDLLVLLRTTEYVEIREDNTFLCVTRSDSKMIDYFIAREVQDWFIDRCDQSHRLVINIKGQ